MNSKRLLVAAGMFAILISGCLPRDESTPIDPPEPTLVPTLVPTALPVEMPDVFYIDSGIRLGKISPYVLGTNYGPWVAVPFDMIPAAEEAGITMIRWPGGEWGDQNEIRSYQLDQAFAFAGQLGAELNVQVRLRGGTAEKAAELVRYANIEKGYNIRFWTIGNEPSLYDGYVNTTYNTEIFNREWRAFAEAMRAVDPNIQLLGPEIHQFSGYPDGTPKDSAGRDWMIEFLKANGDLVDIVSFHRYPFPRSMTGPNATIEDLRQNTQEWDGMIDYLNSLIAEYTGRSLPISVAEVNSHFSKASGGEGTPDSLYNAIWWGDVLGRLIRKDVYIVNHWLLTSRANQGGWGLIGAYELRPSYYVNVLYRKLGAERIYAFSDDPFLTVTASLQEDGALALMLINLKAEAVNRPIVLRGMEPETVETWLFDEAHLAENMGTAAFSGEVDLPPGSMTLLVIRP